MTSPSGYNSDKRLGIFYEHPDWFDPLFAELDRRGVPYDRLLAYDHHFDPAVSRSPYALIVNRMSPSAFTRGHGQAIFYTLHYLAYLQEIEANVVNGYTAYGYEISKARQLRLLESLGVRYPRAKVINDPSQALVAAEGLTFPLIMKPNIGGSGAGIQRFDGHEALLAAIKDGELDLGVDRTGLIQEYLPPLDNTIVRVEVLNGEFLYAIRLRLQSHSDFNLCPADYCQPPANGQIGISESEVSNSPPLVEGYFPPKQVIETVERITKVAGIEVGGVEYLVNDRDGQIYYYDVNALSNFVADGPNVIGFDPFPKLVDFLLARAALASTEAPALA